MRLTPESVANGIAWAGILALLAAGLYVVQYLGFPGVLLLGLLTALICVRAELSEDVPSSGLAVFAGSMARSDSPGETATLRETRDRNRSSLRYHRKCGLALTAIGLLGTVRQVWR